MYIYIYERLCCASILSRDDMPALKISLKSSGFDMELNSDYQVFWGILFKFFNNHNAKVLRKDINKETNYNQKEII